MKNLKDAIFLLGGHDLEMLTIKEILQQHGCMFLDLNLRWNNAKLSRYSIYADTFKHYSTIYGIELEKDWDISGHEYIPIDHHNDLSKQPSSLEQILTLFNIRKTRRYELIAENDKFYIPGMEAVGATIEEINYIRTQDRKSQGITENDESLAIKSISENLTRINDLIIIKSYTSFFSTICDRIYPYKSLLIYTPTEFTFYGEKAIIIKGILKKEYETGGIYYGGGENGYIGSKSQAFTESEINNLITKIKHEFI